MQSKALAFTALLMSGLLAGCSDGPASGELVPMAHTLTIEGTLSNDYQAQQLNPSGDPRTCLPQVDPLECTPPHTRITGHLMSLPAPDGNGWSAWANGTRAKQLRELAPGADAGPNGEKMYDFNYTSDADESGNITVVELRMSDYVYATAAGAEGAQVWAIVPVTLTVTGTYKGKTLDVEVGGLPAPSNYVAHLYVAGEDGNVTSAANFPIANGPNHYEDERRDIADYVEFHIHVGNSKINLYKAAIE